MDNLNRCDSYKMGSSNQRAPQGTFFIEEKIFSSRS